MPPSLLPGQQCHLQRGPASRREAVNGESSEPAGLPPHPLCPSRSSRLRRRYRRGRSRQMLQVSEEGRAQLFPKFNPVTPSSGLHPASRLQLLSPQSLRPSLSPPHPLKAPAPAPGRHGFSGRDRPRCSDSPTAPPSRRSLTLPGVPGESSVRGSRRARPRGLACRRERQAGSGSSGGPEGGWRLAAGRTRCPVVPRASARALAPARSCPPAPLLARALARALLANRRGFGHSLWRGRETQAVAQGNKAAAVVVAAGRCRATTSSRSKLSPRTWS